MKINQGITYFITIVLLFITNFTCAQEQDDSIKYSEFVNKDLSSEYSGFKNTSIEIKLPKHYMEFSNDNLSGYMHTGTASSIVAYERNDSPYMLTQDSIRPEQITGEGVKLITQHTVETYKGDPAKVFIVEFTVKEVPVRRIMFFTGNYNKTIFLQANYPAGFDKLLRKVIIESFRTVNFAS